MNIILITASGHGLAVFSLSAPRSARSGRPLPAVCAADIPIRITMYIDPGTGSMLFTILFGAAGTVIYFIRLTAIKVRFRLSGGRAAIADKKLPLVIFSDDKRYWNVFAPICRELDRLGMEVTYYTMSGDDPVFGCGLSNVKPEFIGTGSKAFAKMNMLNAAIVFSTTPGLDVYQWKRSKNVDCYVHITHSANEITLYRMFGVDYYDAILLSGEYQKDDIRSLEKLRGLPEKEVSLVGVPYLDELMKRLTESGAAPEHPTTVLLAPSWGKSAIFGVYGGRIIDALLNTDLHLIIRPHPQSLKSEAELIEKLMKEYPASDRVEWNADTDNFDVLRRSDILISDFSGIVFDFSLVYNKPVIYTGPNFDLSVYDAWWLDKPLWTVSALERIGRQLNEENIGDIGALINECLNDPDLAVGRGEVRSETWAHRGEGARLAAEYLVKKYNELTRSEAGEGSGGSEKSGS